MPTSCVRWFSKKCFNPRVRGGRDFLIVSGVGLFVCFNPRVRGGRDEDVFADEPPVVEFQSARPRGTRSPDDCMHAHTADVSIRASAGDAMRCRTSTNTKLTHGFNPRVRGGRDHVGCTDQLVTTCFNPRVRGGRDGGWYQEGLLVWRVSIRASAGDAMGAVLSGQIGRFGFNPRVRGGRDQDRSATDSILLVVSIRASAGDAIGQRENCRHGRCFNPRVRGGRDWQR